MYIGIGLLSTIFFIFAGLTNRNDKDLYSDPSIVLRLSIALGSMWPISYMWAFILILGDLFKDDESDETEVS